MRPHNWKIVDEGPKESPGMMWENVTWQKGEIQVICTNCSCQSLTTRTKLATGLAWEDGWHWNPVDLRASQAPEDCNEVINEILVYEVMNS